jgi:HEAT repeat protein
MPGTPALLTSRLAGLDRPEDRPARDRLILDALGDPSGPVRESAVAWAARCFEPAALLPLLADAGNAALRNAALAALERQGPYAVEAVEQATAAADGDLAMFACQVLGSIGGRSSLGPLLGALQRPEVNVVQAAAEALGRLGLAEAVGGLSSLLRREPWLQLAAADALGAIGDPAAAEPLLALVPDSLMAEPALDALRRIASPVALPRLLALFEDPAQIRLRQPVLLALGTILEQHATDALPTLGRRVEADHGPGSLWQFLAERLGETAAATPGAAAPRDDRAGQRGGGAPLRAAATVVLAAGVGSLLPLVFRWGECREIRPWLAPLAARFAGSIGPAALRLSSHPDQAVRAGLLLTLPPVLLGSAGALAGLADPGLPVRLAACEALALAPDPAAAAALVELLDHGSTAERDASIRALARLPAALVEPLFAARLAGGSEAVILAVLAALAEGPPRGLEEQILELASGPAGPVRRAALRAAVAIPGTRAEVLLLRALADRDPAVQVQALDLLVARDGERVRTTLLALLQAGDSLRYHVIRALGRLRVAAAVRPLEVLFAAAPLHERIEIVTALARIGEEQVRPFLLLALEDGEPEIRRVAAQGLAGLAGPDDFDLLGRLAGDSDWVVRSEAARGFGRLAVPAARRPLLDLARDLEPAVARTARAALAAR